MVAENVYYRDLYYLCFVLKNDVLTRCFFLLLLMNCISVSSFLNKVRLYQCHHAYHSCLRVEDLKIRQISSVELH